MKIHKQGCMANISCLAIHLDGVCPGPYGKCTCDTLPETLIMPSHQPPKSEKCEGICNHCSYKINECPKDHSPASNKVKCELHCWNRSKELNGDHSDCEFCCVCKTGYTPNGIKPSPASTEEWENRIWRWATNHAKGIHSDEFATLFEEIRSIRAQATEAGYQKGIKDGSK